MWLCPFPFMGEKSCSVQWWGWFSCFLSPVYVCISIFGCPFSLHFHPCFLCKYSSIVFSSCLVSTNLNFSPSVSLSLSHWKLFSSEDLVSLSHSLSTVSCVSALGSPPSSSFHMKVMDRAYGWVGCERGHDEDWPWWKLREREREKQRFRNGRGLKQWMRKRG